jgi:hypothetical protein
LRCDEAIIIWMNSNIWFLNLAAFENNPISDWIKVLLGPQKFLAIPNREFWRFHFFANVVLDVIRFSRNQVIHNYYKIDIVNIMKFTSQSRII